MDQKEKEIMDYNKNIMKKILKSLGFTLIVLMFSIWGIFGLVSLIFINMSGEQADTWLIISIGIGIIFTVFYCTLTILEEIKKIK